MKFLLRTGLMLASLALQPALATDLPGSENLTAKAELGRKLFFDTNLSEPAGQACGSCHDPNAAFTDPDRTHPTSKGVDPNLFGNRNTPTAMYAAFSPKFYFDRATQLFMGGQFLDGRAASLIEQAKGPFLNPLEMANPNAASVVEKVRNSDYAEMFDSVFGEQALADVDQAYQRIAEAIAEFERSPVFNRFSSKYDFYLFGKAKLSLSERRGLKVFENKGECAACHPNRPQNGKPPLFTDFSYDNLGVPKNPENPFYAMPAEFNPNGELFVDIGLGNAVKKSLQNGKFKVPTLRNIAVTAPYMHNGYFKTLEGAIELYSSRDTRKTCREPQTGETEALRQKCWPQAEADMNVNHAELGSLNLNQREIKDLAAFLKTLTDGYGATSPWRNTTPP